MPSRRVLVGLLVTIGVAHAQQKPADPLAPLRNKTTLSSEDRATLTSWIRGRLDLVVGNDAGAARQLRTAATGSDAFRKAYVATLAGEIRTRLAKADPPVAARLIALLVAVSHAASGTDAVPTLLELLKDNRPAVRASAIVALRSLRDRIRDAGGNLPDRVLAALRDAGPQVRAYAPLRRLYEAMDLAANDARRQRAVAEAITSVLEQRARLHTGQNVPAEGAEATAFDILTRLAARLDDATRKRALAASGAILRHAVGRYVRDLIDVPDDASRVQVLARNRIERLVLAGQNLLAALLQPSDPPPLTQAMQKQRKADAVKRQWNRWAALLKAATGQDFSLQ